MTEQTDGQQNDLDTPPENVLIPIEPQNPSHVSTRQDSESPQNLLPDQDGVETVTTAETEILNDPVVTTRGVTETVTTRDGVGAVTTGVTETVTTRDGVGAVTTGVTETVTTRDGVETVTTGETEIPNDPVVTTRDGVEAVTTGVTETVITRDGVEAVTTGVTETVTTGESEIQNHPDVITRGVTETVTTRESEFPTDPVVTTRGVTETVTTGESEIPTDPVITTRGVTETVTTGESEIPTDPELTDGVTESVTTGDSEIPTDLETPLTPREETDILGNPTTTTTTTKRDYHISLWANENFKTMERNASECSRNLLNLFKNLQTGLHSISGKSAEHMEVFKLASDELGTQVNQSVLGMHCLVTKCQQLNSDLKKAEELHRTIKEIRKSLDVFDGKITKLIKSNK